MNSTEQITSSSDFASDDSCSTTSMSHEQHTQRQQSNSHPKEVRFAIDQSETPSLAETIDIPPPENDASKSREDLLTLITLLRNRLISLTIALSGERVLRKKKDRTIFKLAKQFNLKSEEGIAKEKEINAVRYDLLNECNHSSIERRNLSMILIFTLPFSYCYKQLLAHQAILETDLSQVKKQLSDLHHEMDKASREYNLELTTLQNSNRIMVQKYDDRIASIQSYHSKQSEELRRQILTSQLETDRIRLKYASLQMKCYPRRADRIAKRTVKDAIKNTTQVLHDSMQHHSSIATYYDSDERRAIRFWRLFGFIFCLLILPAIALAHSYHILSFDVLCAPSRPYTIFDSSYSYHEAPWWLPSSLFSDIFTSTQRYKIFTLVCEDRPYTRLEWIDMGIAGHKLIVWDNRDTCKMDDSCDEQDHIVPTKKSFPQFKFKKNPILLEKRASMALILGSSIEFTNWSGKVEKKKAPWAID